MSARERMPELAQVMKRNAEYFPDGEIADMGPAYLRAMGEPSLAPGPGDGPVCYRFLWMRSFREPVVVRIHGPAAQLSVVAKSWSGMPLPDAGSLSLNTTRPLSEFEARRLQSLVDAARFWHMAPRAGDVGLDGAFWILEGRDETSHRILRRWSPKAAGPDAQFRELCAFMLELAGQSPDEVR